MLIKRSETGAAKRRRLENWHIWFAWFPVQIQTGDWVWLERVLRKCTFIEGFDGGYCLPKYWGHPR